MSNYDSVIEYLQNVGVITKTKRISPAYKRILTNIPEVGRCIIDTTKWLQYDASIKVRIQCILTNIHFQPTCKSCNKIVKMIESGRRRYTFPTYCSSKCTYQHPEVLEKRKATNLRKYGATNYLNSKEGKERIKKTLMVKYNVDNAALIPHSIAKRNNTIISKYGSMKKFYLMQQRTRLSTNITRYGVAHVMQVPEIKLKQQQTCIKRYNVTNVFQSPIIQQRIKHKMNERYGVDRPIQSPEILRRQHNTMKKRYGVFYAFQSPELLRKQHNTMKKRYGVPHYTLSLFSPSTLSKLQNPQWLRYQHCVNKKSLSTIADELGVTRQTVGLYFNKYNIKILTYQTSHAEFELYQFILSLLPTDHIIRNTRSLISPLEIDIYIPKFNLAFEYNGNYWHGELNGKYRLYHLDKTNKCSEMGIRLIHISESEWYLKREIVKSRIRNLLQQSNTIYARQCEIVTLTSQETKDFLEQNHIQGNCSASIKYGLKKDGKLVACMTFGKSRFTKKYDYELLRYANVIGTSVVGGASRLFKHFINFNYPTTVVSYSDKRWNTGQLYELLGFHYSHTSLPSYRYFKRNDAITLLSRLKYQKHKLSKILDDFNPSLTEWENMKNNGFDRIWDCGNDVWVWNK